MKIVKVTPDLTFVTDKVVTVQLVKAFVESKTNHLDLSIEIDEAMGGICLWSETLSTDLCWAVWDGKNEEVEISSDSNVKITFADYV